MERQNYEKEALEKFVFIAKKNNCLYYFGQKTGNTIPIKGLVNFQFGDFRIDTNENHLVIELESAGGVTNLVKYWYCLEDKDISLKKIISKPIILFHIFRQVSENDYLSHLLLWDFLWGKMKSSLASKIIAKRYTYRK
ncbi:unnamed protein product, partial [marine sediment metagenome]